MDDARFQGAPHRIAQLPTDPRGFPVPWFVSWQGEQPRFPVISAARLGQAWKDELCWICGQKLGAFRAWVIGPLCVLERACPEPPSHLDCAEFATRSCPFLASPLAKRQGRPDAPDFKPAANQSSLHTGVVALWVTKGRGAKPFKSGGGVLFALDEAARVEWRALGRPATRGEVTAALEAGLPLLLATARSEGAQAVAELQRRTERTQAWLPKT